MATVARAAIQIEYAHLAFELVDSAEHHGNAVQCACVVDQVARLVIVGTVDHQIVAVDFFQDVRGIEFNFFGNQFDVLVDVLDLVLGRCDFRALDIACAVKYLTLQVFKRDLLKINDLDGAHACRGKVLDNRGTERPCASDHHFCGLDSLLSLDADFTQHQVPAETFNFRIVKRDGLPPFI